MNDSGTGLDRAVPLLMPLLVFIFEDKLFYLNIFSPKNILCPKAKMLNRIVVLSGVGLFLPGLPPGLFRNQFVVKFYHILM